MRRHLRPKTFAILLCAGALALVAYAAWLHLWAGTPRPAGGSDAVWAWWRLLSGIAVLNIVAWTASALLLLKWGAPLRRGTLALPWAQLLLSAAYVFGCAFRSFLPRVDVSKAALIDSPLSTVFIGRSVATVAEICFAVQWALLLHALSRRAEDAAFARVVSLLIVPLIVLAEACSWYAVITTSYVGNVVEESLWALSAALAVAAILTLWRHFRAYRFLFPSVVLLGTGYVLYMCAVDVPMYMLRWMEQLASGHVPLGFGEGLADLASRWVVDASWETWRSEIPWMTLYFSVAVWSSIALIHVAWFEQAEKKIA